MYKMPVTYENFDGETVTEDIYFNLSKMEIIRLEAETPGGLEKYFSNIVNSNNNAEILAAFEWFIGVCYGVRSEDGKLFLKEKDGQKLIDSFKGTAAYDQALWDLAMDEKKASEFVTKTIPSDQIKKLMANVQAHA